MVPSGRAPVAPEQPERPSAEGIELIGHHEVLLPLLHVALECELAKPAAVKVEEAAAAA